MDWFDRKFDPSDCFMEGVKLELVFTPAREGIRGTCRDRSREEACVCARVCVCDCESVPVKVLVCIYSSLHTADYIGEGKKGLRNILLYSLSVSYIVRCVYCTSSYHPVKIFRKKNGQAVLKKCSTILPLTPLIIRLSIYSLFID